MKTNQGVLPLNFSLLLLLPEFENVNAKEAKVEIVAKNAVSLFKFKVKWDFMEHRKSKTTNGTMHS